jgi:hypothetical protein
MLSNPTFELIGQRPIRPADQTPNVAFCIALTRFDDRIENSEEAATALTPRRRCGCAHPYFSSHASAYRKRPNNSEMKLSDDLIALADKIGMSRACRAEKRALEVKPYLPTRAYFSVRRSRSVAYSAACILTGVGRASFRNSLSALEINASWR